MTILWQDVRYGLRVLRRNPGFTAVAIATLALGIGANTAIFSVVDGVLLRPLPYPHPDRLVVVESTSSSGPETLAPPDFLKVRAQDPDFTEMAAYRSNLANLSGAGEPETVRNVTVTTNFFDAIGVAPYLGRTFGPADQNARAAVLAYGFWQRKFGGSASILGRQLDLNGELYTVVGVMPPAFVFPEADDLWLSPRFVLPEHPLRPTVDPSTLSGSHYFDAFARLRPGVSLAQANSDLGAVMARIARENSNSELRGQGPLLVGLHEFQTSNVRPALLVLFGAVGLLLLIACANVANLILAQAAARSREWALRTALGASRSRLIRQVVTETMLVGVGGGVAGWLGARWLLPPLVRLVPAEIRSSAALTIDLRMLIFAVVVSLVASLLVGLYAALSGSRPRAGGELQARVPGSLSDRQQHRSQSRLVVLEMALAVMLLAGAGLLVRSFVHLSEVKTGFNATSVLTLRLTLPQARYPDPASRSLFARKILDEMRAIPGVSSASLATRLPLEPGRSRRSIDAEGVPEPITERILPDYNAVGPNYFRALGIPVVAGREFADSDSATSQPVAVISRGLAELLWPGRNPIGQKIRVSDAPAWREVVGVAGDVHEHDLSRTPPQIFYVPYSQDPWTFLSVTVRAAIQPIALVSAVEHAIHDVDRDEPVSRIQTMEQVEANSIAPPRFHALLLGLFAAVGLLLAALGIYGVISHGVTRRTQEIGLRMALGAETAEVLRMVLSEGGRLALAGLAIGVAGALALTHWMHSLLYGVTAWDPATYAATAALLIVIALAACAVPALRATRVDPATALRHE